MEHIQDLSPLESIPRETSNEEAAPVKRKPGRPKGSKNRVSRFKHSVEAMARLVVPDVVAASVDGADTTMVVRRTGIPRPVVERVQEMAEYQAVVRTLLELHRREIDHLLTLTLATIEDDLKSTGIKRRRVAREDLLKILQHLEPKLQAPRLTLSQTTETHEHVHEAPPRGGIDLEQALRLAGVLTPLPAAVDAPAAAESPGRGIVAETADLPQGHPDLPEIVIDPTEQ